MSKVAIIGAGMMGTAMCWPLVDNGHEVNLCGTPLDKTIIDSIRHDGLHPTLDRPVPKEVHSHYAEETPGLIDSADWIINGVSSFGIPWFAESICSQVRSDQVVLSVTKGLEVLDNGDLITMPDAIRRRIPTRKAETIRINAIAGPCIAHELPARRQTGVVFTGDDLASLDVLKRELGTNYYHIWTSTDMTGVEVCAALKNAYAMGVGMAVGMMEQAGQDGKAHMYNPQAALFAQSIFEMGKLLKRLGGDIENLHWLPGPGDLYVTVFGGRTVALGKLLGKGISFIEARQLLKGVTLESVEIITNVALALPKLEDRGLMRRDDFPLLLHLNDIINHAASVDIPWDKFFKGRK